MKKDQRRSSYPRIFHQLSLCELFVRVLPQSLFSALFQPNLCLISQVLSCPYNFYNSFMSFVQFKNSVIIILNSNETKSPIFVGSFSHSRRLFLSACCIF